MVALMERARLEQTVHRFLRSNGRQGIAGLENRAHDGRCARCAGNKMTMRLGAGDAGAPARLCRGAARWLFAGQRARRGGGGEILARIDADPLRFIESMEDREAKGPW